MTRGWSCHLAVSLEASRRAHRNLRVAKLRLALQQLLKLGTPLQPINFFVATRFQWPYSFGGHLTPRIVKGAAC